MAIESAIERRVHRRVCGVVFALLFAPSLFNQGISATSAPTTASLSMLLHWSTLGMAMLFCFILNLLCTGVPAWRASRSNIVNSL